MLALALVLGTLGVAVASPEAILVPHAPRWVIAHRGASGYLPEHTLQGHALGVDLGADYAELDVQSTRDGVLIAMHSIDLREVTDVADLFPSSRMSWMMFAGMNLTGYLVPTFTFEELQQLRVLQRYAPLGRDPLFDNTSAVLRIPSVACVLTMLRTRACTSPRVTAALSNASAGVYIETKYAALYDALGLSLEPRLLNVLTAAGYTVTSQAVTRPGSSFAVPPVIFQSFEPDSLARLAQQMPSVPRVLLLSAPFSPSGPNPECALGVCVNFTRLAQYATTCQALGVEKYAFLLDAAGRPMDTRTAVALVNTVHAAGLAVHTWTYRDEATFIPSQFLGDPIREYRFYLWTLHVDGIFSEYVDKARFADATPPAAQAAGDGGLHAWVVVLVAVGAAVLGAVVSYGALRWSSRRCARSGSDDGTRFTELTASQQGQQLDLERSPPTTAMTQ